jgi:hypothetical protein
MNKKLSVIIPYVNEYPQVIFTIRAIAEEFKGRVDFEILAINNYSKDMDRPEDKGSEVIEVCSKGNPWLVPIEYKNHLSHWAAKHLGTEKATGDIFLFCDAHVSPGRDALFKAFDCYQSSHAALGGTLHMPLTYKILEWRKLIYGLVVNRDIGQVHYTFAGYRNAELPYEVPCMSTCGMFITRELYEATGGWPTTLGSYGGGENFMNFVLSVLGKKKFIMPGEPLYHHGERRDYRSTVSIQLYNRMTANYLFGGVKWLELMTATAKGNAKIKNQMMLNIVDVCREQRQFIKDNQKTSIENWLEEWGK